MLMLIDSFDADAPLGESTVASHALRCSEWLDVSVCRSGKRWLGPMKTPGYL